MSSDAHEVSKMVGIYKKLFLVLTLITALGIGIAYVHMPVWLAVIIAFGIIMLKSKIVLSSFQHLLTGRYVLLLLFGLTVTFFIVLVFLTAWNQQCHLLGTKDTSKDLQMQAIKDKPAEKAQHGH